MGCTPSKRLTSAAVDALFDSDGELKLEDDLKMVRIGKQQNSHLITEAIDVLSRAFCGNETAIGDLSFDWVYDPQNSGGEDPKASPPSEERSKWFKYSMDFSVQSTLPLGGCYALVRDGKVVGVCLTKPPSAKGCHDLGMCGVMGVLSKLGSAPKPGLDCFTPLDNAMKKLHKQHASSRHLYLFCIGCDPSQQGKGHGRAMGKFIGILAGADQVDVYLETTGTRNLAFYAKSGFVDKGCLPLQRKGVPDFAISGGLHAMVKAAPSEFVPENTPTKS